MGVGIVANVSSDSHALRKLRDVPHERKLRDVPHERKLRDVPHEH